ncbi:MULTISPECIES: bifunctional [glutamine synthetase] adenylyltransferase/[glutamine synthetase]-adenylyl-L-tyrosine phosphorylase [unclassified Beijerinckia]|uniref:bifunctional [glutamine synthetase] adenylyltransferase/[glutamine synthetase]-adenylyl-L-tyrosine phosphorylase n=1 Tax=unclassified Beijerinckia TaxID=2638183 RepID=UPI0008948183|nr:MULTISPECIES: bifunctional [glutamine synthetase] adenylyltransferase/[glutamine synthetase]-adenylyl-L-tyrosine phosphorylase [unclassified Beijerinckia]MDH7796335.1 glutamate-ammonia-ligase adenylyltransferase [Beijerinckia sp. GAS462]SEC40585.1 glutamate-ammonia-ligase adenylyltransferase [Beijerinckia sp. 28-YEA-48]
MSAAKKSPAKPRNSRSTGSSQNAIPLDNRALARRILTAPLVGGKAAHKLTDLEIDLGFGADAETAGKIQALLQGVAEHSPYLWGLSSADTDRLRDLLTSSPEDRFDDCLERMRVACTLANDDDAVLHALRKGKQEGHLLIALCDLGGVWQVDAVMTAVSHLADVATRAATAYALRAAHHAGRLKLADPAEPERACGLVLLALGKHGAGELNYSSDIDLVAFFDPQTEAIDDPSEGTRIYVRVTQHIAKLLQEHTGDGYAFRVDLRLRPDPGSTPVAVSLPAAFSYYELLGQNWERAAFIKARPVAGEIALGETFLKDLTPFMWRRYFDYAAIADIHAMKRQIHAVRGFAEIAVAGHNIKVGRGGIREVEFFVQTQQLIFGGRRPQLRGPRTLDMLSELAADGWITPDAVSELSTAYRFLREIEHRLQMVADEQTQRLPADAEVLEGFAQFCGYRDGAAFGDALLEQLACVERHYARLFEAEPELSSSVGNLVFTGVTDDPETLETLSKLGFANPALAAETVRGWHFGRRPAMQSARAREVVTALVPALLEAFGGSGDADAALLAFDHALMRMPAAVELFSILKSNDKVRELFADILGGAPRLAQMVSLRPHVLDAAIDPTHSAARSGESRFEARALRILETAHDSEQFMDDCRDLAQEEMFVIGIRFLAGTISAEEVGLSYSALADALLRVSLQHVESAFAVDHGTVPGARCAIIGMGKLGSREMTAASDLDLILIYDYDDETPESDGARPLHAAQYYARLTKRLVAVLTSATRRGKLYDVDLRLRPSGGQGPVATRFTSFVDYQQHEAETWEHMALVRARVIAGDATLGEQIEAARAAIICRQSDEKKLQKDIAAMRGLIAREKGDADPWDLKLAAGGIIDIEFIAQFLALAHAGKHPEIAEVSTLGVLRKAAAVHLLSPGDGEQLITACAFYQAVTQMMRLTIEGPFDPTKVASSVLRRIASSVNLPDFGRVELMLTETRADVRKIFTRLIGAPGKSASGKASSSKK